jgi:hypothetical protein
LPAKPSQRFPPFDSHRKVRGVGEKADKNIATKQVTEGEGLAETKNRKITLVNSRSTAYETRTYPRTRVGCIA